MKTEIYDFSKSLIRCSRISDVVSDGKTKSPKQQYEDLQEMLAIEMEKYDSMGERRQGMSHGLSKAAKIAGIEHELRKLEPKKHEHPLSVSAKSYLKSLYGELKYNKKSIFKEKGNKYTNKGHLVQAEAVELVSKLDGIKYLPNEERYNNDFITGIPDAYIGKHVLEADFIMDVKGSWEWDTFSENLDSEKLPNNYWWQLQGYFFLSGANEGSVDFCLISLPEQLLNEEIERFDNDFKKRHNLIDPYAHPDYANKLTDIVNNLTFDDMPENDRRLKFKVQRDEAAINKIKEFVPKCREYLFELQEKHLTGVFSDKELPFLEKIEEL